MCAYIHSYIHTYIYTHKDTHIHIDTYTYIQTGRHTCTHPYIHNVLLKSCRRVLVYMNIHGFSEGELLRIPRNVEGPMKREDPSDVVLRSAHELEVAHHAPP